MDLKTLGKDVLEERYEKAKLLLTRLAKQKKDHEYVIEEIEIQMELFQNDIEEMEEILKGETK